MRILALLIIFFELSHALLEGVESVEARFKQRVHSSEGGAILYTGELYAKAPYYGLWKYQKPLHKEVYIHDKQVIIYEPELEQATFSTLQGSLDFLALLHGAKRDEKGVYRARIGEMEYQIFVDEAGNPEQIRFIDSLQNEVEILFESLRLNPPLERELFLFTPPAGTDIIRP